MNIVIAGNYGADNIGDEMILEGILEKLRTFAPKAKITVFSGSPKETEERHNVHSVEKFPSGIKSWAKNIFKLNNPTKKAVKNCDFFIFGGGGLFGSLTFRANIIWGIQGFMAMFYKKPVLICGQSIGPIKGRVSKFIVKNLFKKAKIIIVRDRESKKRLKKMRINRKVYLMPDMAFRIREPKGAKPRKKTIIVALRQMEGLSQEFKNNIYKFLNWMIKEEDWEIKFINFQNGDRGDSTLHKEIIEMIHDKKKVKYIDKISNNEELFEHFLEAKCVLGMRLHSIITAIKTRTPFIAINYAPKVKGFLNYAKLNDYVLDPEELTSGGIFKHFTEIEKNEKRFVNEMDKYNKDAFRKHLEIEEKFKDLVASLVSPQSH